MFTVSCWPLTLGTGWELGLGTGNFNFCNLIFLAEQEQKIFMSRTRNDVDIKKGMALLHMGKYTEALAIFEKLKKSFPDDLGLKLDIARCHELKRDFTKANTLYQALLE
jgi:tetratricopeptide (TPR) repeat protein